MKIRLVQLGNFLLPIAIVLASALCVHLYSAGSSRVVTTDSQHHSANTPVELGKDYYVFVKLVEVAATDADGSAWDSNDSAPDLVAEITWRGQRVYRSSVRSDSLIAKWSPAELDLRDIAMTGAKASMEGVLKAARLNIAAGEELTVSVFDEDLLGSLLPDSDSAGSLVVKTTDLMLGDQLFTAPAPAIRRIILSTASMDAPPQILP